MGGRRGSLAAWSLATLAIAVAALTLAVGGPGRLAEELASISLWKLAASTSLLVAAEALKGARLCILAGRQAGLSSCVKARLLGKAASAVSPAGAAGVPTRGAVLAGGSGIELGRALGAALGETLADNIIALGVILGGALLGHASIPVVLVALFVAFLWVGGSAAATSARIAAAIYRRLRLPEELRCGIERERELALQALATLLTRRAAPPTLALTVASHLMEAASIMVYWGRWGDPLAWLLSLIALEASYIMVSMPTPGGSGAVEYALIAYLGPSLALYWRLTYLIASLLPLALAYTVVPSLRDYLESYTLKGECSGASNAGEDGGL